MINCQMIKAEIGNILALLNIPPVHKRETHLLDVKQSHIAADVEISPHVESISVTEKNLGARRTEPESKPQVYKTLQSSSHPYLSSLNTLKRLHWRDTQQMLIAYRRKPDVVLLRNRILEGNLHIVVRTVLTIFKKHNKFDLDDLLSEGYLGLLSAVEKFDKLGSSSFGAYAGYWIMQHINRYMGMNDSPVRIPCQTREKIRTRQLQVLPSGRVVRSDSNDDKGFYALVNPVDPYLSVVERNDSHKDLDQVILNEFCSFDTNLESLTQTFFDVNKFDAELNDREKGIVRARNGYKNDALVTLDVLSEQHKCTRERVRQLEQSGYEKLRSALANAGYKSIHDFHDQSLEEYARTWLDGFTFSSGRLVEFQDFSFAAEESRGAAFVEPLTHNAIPQQLIFTKKVKYSYLTSGVVIPIAAEDDFYSNIDTTRFVRGVPYPIKIVFCDRIFRAKAFWPRLDNQIYNNINIRWCKYNPIADLLQIRHKYCFEQFKRNRDYHSDCEVSLFATKDRDVFILKDIVKCSSAGNRSIADIKDDLKLSRVESDNNAELLPVKDGDNAVSSLQQQLNQPREIENVVMQSFPAGFLFNAATIKLLESTLGRECSKGELRDLRREMFKRSDEVYLLPAMVAEEKVIGDLLARIRGFWEAYGCFALSVLYKEFEGKLKNLTNPDSDFRLFLQKAVLPQFPEGGKVFGKLQRQLCIPEDAEEEETIKNLAERVRGVLLENGDAMLQEDLLGNLFYLNAPIIEMLLKESIPDAVEIKVDEQSYWKLVEFFYLPDDFKDFLQEAIRRMESNHAAPSLQALSEAMELQYGADFRSDYAIDDDDVFKQVIAVNTAGEDYVWNRNVFVKQGACLESNVADEFLQIQRGIFHESDFFAYAEKHRGLTNQATLICGYLRPRSIRLDQFHWIPINIFDCISDFSENMGERIKLRLSSMLGQKTYLPIGTLPDAFYSSLPPIAIGGQIFYWNPYMLTSVAVHKIHSLRIINDEPSPYIVTAMLIPDNVKYNNDVVNYVFSDLWAKGYNFSSGDEVFEFLKKNQIRVRKTKQLMARINEFGNFYNV